MGYDFAVHAPLLQALVDEHLMDVAFSQEEEHPTDSETDPGLNKTIYPQFIPHYNIVVSIFFSIILILPQKVGCWLSNVPGYFLSFRKLSRAQLLRKPESSSSGLRPRLPNRGGCAESSAGVAELRHCHWAG